VQDILKKIALVLLEREITSTQATFFGQAQTLRSALAVDSPEELLRKFSSGTTEARATLHLARAAATLGHVDTAGKLASCGLAMASDRAAILRSELQTVLDSLKYEAAQPAAGAAR
jgi:hypothetical protein